MDEGLVEEVRGLKERWGLTRQDLEYYGLEYRYVGRYLEGDLTYDEMFTRLNTAIHQFAKRQMTWFRRMERNGFDIHWLEGQLEMDEKLQKAIQMLSRD
jgi:tRNA dimethylallyltransferase